MPRTKKPPIADRDEILATITRILRGEPSPADGATLPKVAEQVRAAELLGKQYGLFEKRDDSRIRPALSEALRRTLEEMHNANRGA